MNKRFLSILPQWIGLPLALVLVMAALMAWPTQSGYAQNGTTPTPTVSSPLDTPTATPTATPTETLLPPTDTPTATLEPTATSTETPTATAEPSATSTATATLEPTATSTSEPTATSTATSTPTNSTPTVTFTPVPDTGVILGYHTVRAGETLFCIGRAYGVDPYAIARQNAVINPNVIRAGHVLAIPSVPRVLPAGTACPRQFDGATPVPPTCRLYHTVVWGENLYRLSLRYGVSIWSIAATNSIPNVHYIRAGQVLCIP